jgi:glycylpeptide N-tetradecanoyltransferase
MSPGWRKDWHIGIRATTKTRKLLAFIAAIPVELRVRDKILKSSEVNFICVHKGLRGKRLAPVLIKEITRLINRQDIWQAIYTAGVVLPKPVSTCRYYHRAINWQKLYEIGFSPLPHGSKPAFQVRKYALPDQTTTRGLREMQAKDVPKVQKLLERYLKRYELAPVFNEEEVRHWLLHDPAKVQEQVVWSYVVEVGLSSIRITESLDINELHIRTIKRRSRTSFPFTPWNPPSSAPHHTRWSAQLICSTTRRRPASQHRAWT